MQASLQGVFLSFTANKQEMDGKTFAKVAKDCGLLDKKLTPTDVDLAFAKVKTSAAVRTITLPQFEQGVAKWAEKKGVPVDQVRDQILQKGGPQFNGTKADAVKFHDDKSLYTGVHVNGGPTNVDNHHGGLDKLCDRKAADVRGVKK